MFASDRDRAVAPGGRGSHTHADAAVSVLEQLEIALENHNSALKRALEAGNTRVFGNCVDRVVDAVASWIPFSWPGTTMTARACTLGAL